MSDIFEFTTRMLFFNFQYKKSEQTHSCFFAYIEADKK